MATQIFSSDLNYDYPLTSRIYSVRASVDPDTDSVPVSVKVGPVNLLETVIYPYGGIATLYNVGRLIEEGMRKSMRSSQSVTISFGDDSVIKNFVYCEHAVPQQFDPSDSPLMACMYPRVSENSIIAFNCLDLGLASFATLSASAMCRTANDSSAVVHTEISVNQSNCSATLNVADLIAAFKAQNSSVSKVLYFTLAFAGKSATYYIVPQPPCVRFSFRNIFNAEEYLDVRGVMKRHTDSSVSDAVCSEKRVQYDRLVSQSFQVESAPVNMEEVHAYEQMLSSYSVKVLAGAEWLEAQITDFTSEPSSDDSSLVTFKFTWRFADRRPRVFDSDVFGILPSEGGIFTQQYNYVYE